LYPGGYFQEKLVQERNRALRSHKPLVVMLLDAEKLGFPDHPGEITDSLSKVVNACVRESDICGLLKEDTLIGVILTEVEQEKVGIAQSIIAGKTRVKLDAILNHELADRIAISFHIFSAAGGKGVVDTGSSADSIETGGEVRMAAQDGQVPK